MQSHLDKINLNFPIIGFCGHSGVGKTTLLSKLIPILKRHDLKLGIIKHAHHAINFDNKGTTLAIANKNIDVYASSAQISFLEKQQKNMSEQQALLAGIADFSNLPIDLLLIEGFKTANFPKIELHRKDNQHALMCYNDISIIAIATDDKELQINLDNHRELILLDINDCEQIAKWILKQLNLLKH